MSKRIFFCKPNDKDSFRYLVSPLPEGMYPMVAVDVAMLLGVEIGRVVKVLPFSLSHN